MTRLYPRIPVDPYTSFGGSMSDKTQGVYKIKHQKSDRCITISDAGVVGSKEEADSYDTPFSVYTGSTTNTKDILFQSYKSGMYLSFSASNPVGFSPHTQASIWQLFQFPGSNPTTYHIVHNNNYLKLTDAGDVQTAQSPDENSGWILVPCNPPPETRRTRVDAAGRGLGFAAASAFRGTRGGPRGGRGRLPSRRLTRKNRFQRL
jgi:hypothetical protein